MQRRSLTNSRHTSTTGPRDNTSWPFCGKAPRLLAVTGLTAALLIGASTGIAKAVDDPAGSTITAPSTTVAASGPRTTQPTSAPSTRERQVARSGKATARERRNAREVIRQQVADLATRQLGDAYRSGAEGPNAFDCSGLTLFAWQSTGVQLTHYSAGQYQQVKPIRPEAAMPGDLVFYLEGGARHVGVYVGDGMLVHASDYGVGVIRTPVRGTPWTNTHFTGFGRVTIPEGAIKETVKEIRQRRGRV